MDKAELRKKVQSLIDELPDETSWAELMHKIRELQSLEHGPEDVEEERPDSHETVTENRIGVGKKGRSYSIGKPYFGRYGSGSASEKEEGKRSTTYKSRFKSKVRDKTFR